jgi:hypothetical protein
MSEGNPRAGEGSEPEIRPLRESEVASAWLVAQQAAQIVGEVGAGIGGIAGAVHVATHLKGSKQEPPPPPPPEP